MFKILGTYLSGAGCPQYEPVDSYVMELALASVSADGIGGSTVLARLSTLDVTCEDLERNRLLRFISFFLTDATEDVLLTGKAGSSGASAEGDIVGGEVGIGLGRLTLDRAFET